MLQRHTFKLMVSMGTLLILQKGHLKQERIIIKTLSKSAPSYVHFSVCTTCVHDIMCWIACASLMFIVSFVLLYWKPQTFLRWSFFKIIRMQSDNLRLGQILKQPSFNKPLSCTFISFIKLWTKGRSLLSINYRSLL